MWKNYFLEIKNSFLELEKDFIELEDKELKGGKVKIKTEIEVLFFNPINVSINDMDRFEKKWRKQGQLKALLWLVEWLYLWALKKMCRWF